jgi:hypothetical protein
MPRPEVSAVLIDEKTRAFLEEPHVAVMATVNRDGR